MLPQAKPIPTIEKIKVFGLLIKNIEISPTPPAVNEKACANLRLVARAIAGKTKA